MPTHVTTLTYRTSDASYSLDKTVTEEEEINVQVTVTAGVQTVLDPVILTVASIKSIMVTATAACTMTPVATSTDGTPISLTADTPIIWSSTGVIGASSTLFAGATVAGCTKIKLDSTAGCVFTLRALISAA